MAFSFTVIHETIMGALKMIYGTFTNTDGSTGGEISLKNRVHYITHVSLQHTGSSVVSDNPVVNESEIGLPPRINKDSFTIVTVANTSGLWFATGV